MSADALAESFAETAQLVIVGATASGKSALAVRMAQALGGDVVSVDSMAVYRGMDIGTAKPTAEERAGVVHHLTDLVEPSEDFSVSQFQSAARRVLQGRGPFVLAGGTGLYVDAVVNDFEIPGQFPQVRGELAGLSLADQYARLVDLDPIAAARIEPGNERRVLRALEVTVGSGRPFSSFGPGLQESRLRGAAVVGLRWPREALAERIGCRIAQQMERGFLHEVAALADRFGPELSRTSSQALGYRELLGHLRGESALEDAVEATRVRTVAFSKRQERWFRRDPRVHWIEAADRPSEDLALEVLTLLGR